MNTDTCLCQEIETGVEIEINQRLTLRMSIVHHMYSLNFYSTCVVYEGVICIEYVWGVLSHVQCELALHLDDLIRVHYSSISIRC